MLLNLAEISYYTDRGLILDNAAIDVNEHDRIGIVGRNGSGKSTLLKIMAGVEEFHGGEREVKNNARVLLIEQDVVVDDRTPLEYLRDMDKELQHLYQLIEKSDNNNFGEVQDKIFQLENERYEIAAPKILSGLGINIAQQNQPMRLLAGGLRMRIAIASALVQEPDLLLLDEPSNHLDLASVLWLTNFLKTYPKPFVMVSHDKTLLNELITKVYHLSDGKLTSYSGNYDSFLQQYQLKQTQAVEVNKKIDEQREKDLVFVSKFKAKPKWSGIAKSRERLMAKREQERPALIKEESPITIEFPQCAELKNPICELSAVSTGYENKSVLNDINLSIQNNSRIGILGNNGQGKSTLAKLLAGKLEAKSGNVITSPRLKVAYFSQDHAEVLNQNLSAYGQLKQLLTDPSDEDIRKHLAHFGIDKEKIDTPIKCLSGGEKTRLLFALIASQHPHLIIMDEPTNHLDFVAKQALIDAMNAFNGAIITVSHDWELMAKTMKEFYLVHNGKVRPYVNGLEHYREQILKFVEHAQSKPNVKLPQFSLLQSKSAPQPHASKEEKQCSYKPH